MMRTKVATLCRIHSRIVTKRKGKRMFCDMFKFCYHSYERNTDSANSKRRVHTTFENASGDDADEIGGGVPRIDHFVAF